MICISCEEYATSCSKGVCTWCLLDAEFKKNTPDNTVVGQLLDGFFYCNDCASWWPDAKTIPVYKVNIGIYTQICICCRSVVVEGHTAVVLFDVPFKASRKVLQ
jgi:hypothetical protein